MSKRMYAGSCMKNGEEEAGEYDGGDCSLVEDTDNEHRSEWIEQ